MILVKIYQNLFYRFYSFHVWMFKGKHKPQDFGYLLLGVLISFNFLTLLLILETLTGIKISNLWLSYRLTFAILMLILTEILGYFFVRKNKAYLKIIKEFKKESAAERKKYSKLAIVYFAATFLLAFLSAIVWSLTKKT